MPSPTSRAAAPPAAPSTARDPWFDNAKMLLVTLVVVGHSWVLLPDDALPEHAYDFLYVWHVPAFVFVTGYLSRGFGYSRARLWQLFRTVVVPYVIFEALLALFRIYVGGEGMHNLFANPHWPLWYLSALFIWRLLTPVFKPLWGGLAVAVAVSLVAGAYAGNTLDLARVVGLLPFFVMGLKATPERLERLRSRPAQVAAVAAFVGIWVLTYWTDSWAGTDWLYYRSRYDQMDGYQDDARAMVTRALVLALGTLGALAFFALVPRVRGWFTTMGSATLVVYLCHGFVVKGAGYAGWDTWSDAHAPASYVLTTAGAVLVALLLAWEPVSSRLATLVDPLGYGERHLRHAVALTVAKDQVPRQVQAGIESGVEAGLHEPGASPREDTPAR